MSVEKSEKDLRVYQTFVLDNQIKCLVVSDPEAEHSAAAVNVKVGSIHDPQHGIAHFLEHMLFMGTEKYPGENEYSNFLTTHSGFSNAYTASENTNFFFKVASGNFQEALDIFSQFFIKPLFLADSVERELKAVDSEYNKNLQDDMWRNYQILRNSLSPPFNHFGIGNKETLDQEGIRDKVIEFYAKYYSANLMTLVILGKESVEVLKSWAVELFSPIANKNITLPELSIPKFHNKLTITKIIPVKDTRTLKLLWSLPEHPDLYLTKPERYLSHLFGHEGKNSILSYLKHYNLADELTAGNDDDFTTYSYFYIEIKLTEKGLACYESVLEIVYAYVNYLSTHPPEEWIFNELKTVAFSEFTFKNKQDPFWFSRTLSASLHKYPSSKVLTGPELFETFNSSLISQAISHLSAENLQVYLITKTHDSSLFVPEKWYGTLHLTEKISDSLLNKLKNPALDFSQKSLSHPPPNPFIPTSHLTYKLSEFKVPVELLRTEKTRAFHNLSSKFEIDKVYGQVVIYCNSVRFELSVFCYVLGELWVRYLNEKIREEVYQAGIAGLSHSIDIDIHGTKVQVSGFSQKFASFFEFLVNSLATVKILETDLALFEDLKNQIMQKMKNSAFAKPYEQAQRLFYEANLSAGYFPIKAKLAALASIEFSDLIWFSSKWLKNVYFEWLVVGNITSDTVVSMVNSSIQGFESVKSCSFMTDDEFTILKALKVPKNSKNRYVSELFDKNDTNSAVISQWQVGPETNNTQSLIAMIDNYLDESCFDVLRTKEQLGYIVWSYPHKVRGVLNFAILIQSSVKHPSYLFDRISEYIKGRIEDLANINEEKLEKMKISSIKSTFKKDLSVNDEFYRFRQEVDSAAYAFDRKKHVKSCIRGVKVEEFKEFFISVFGENARKMNIQVLADKFKEDEASAIKDEVTYSELNQFWRHNGTWPQVYIRKI